MKQLKTYDHYFKINEEVGTTRMSVALKDGKNQGEFLRTTYQMVLSENKELDDFISSNNLNDSIENVTAAGVIRIIKILDFNAISKLGAHVWDVTANEDTWNRYSSEGDFYIIYDMKFTKESPNYKTAVVGSANDIKHAVFQNNADATEYINSSDWKIRTGFKIFGDTTPVTNTTNVSEPTDSSALELKNVADIIIKLSAAIDIARDDKVTIDYSTAENIKNIITLFNRQSRAAQ